MTDLGSLRTVVIDDETLSREKIIRYLVEFENVELKGEAATATEGRHLILEQRPNLVFVDVRLPDIDGLTMAQEVQRELGADTPHFIVSTAYDSYALRAFDIHAVDYLVKPYSRERFRTALLQATSRNPMAQRSAAMAFGGSRPRRTSYSSRVTFRSNGKLLVFDTREILYVRAADNYIQVHAGGEKILIRAKLGDIESQLDKETFLRTHRGVLINLRHLREVDLTADAGEATVVLTNGSRLPLSRNYRNRILQALRARQ